MEIKDKKKRLSAIVMYCGSLRLCEENPNKQDDDPKEDLSTSDKLKSGCGFR